MGKSVAIVLAKKGASVVIVARNQEKLDTALEEIQVFSLPATAECTPTQRLGRSTQTLPKVPCRLRRSY